MQGTVPPPPGLHRGSAADTGEDAGEVVRALGAGDTAGDAGGGWAWDGGAAGDGCAAQGCTLMGELPPPGCRSETSFSGTGAEPLGRVRSSQ